MTGINTSRVSDLHVAVRHIYALRSDVEFSTNAGGSVFTRDDTEYRFVGISGEIIQAVISRLDGSKTAPAIAQALHLSESAVCHLVEELVKYNLAVAVEGTANYSLSAKEFSSICRYYFPRWKERLFGHPLWRQLGAGQATRSQFIGWLLESFHFIEGVNDRLSLAVAECYDLRMRPLFAHHFSEEYDHYHFFLKALHALGFDEDKVLLARPLPSTLAILNFMRQCARRDPVQYAVCSGFLESTGTDRKHARTFYEYLTQHYCAEMGDVIRPLVEHVGLDEEYGHNNLMEALIECLGGLPMERASAALDAGEMLVETLELWSTDIQRSYTHQVFNIRDDKTFYRPNAAV